MTKPIKRTLYIIISIIILGVLIYPKLPSKQELPQSTGESKRLTVDAIIIHPQNLKNQVKVTGSILADESASLNTEVAGKVDNILFKEGQTVTKGTLLLKLNDEEILAEVDKLYFTRKLHEDSETRQRQLLTKEAISQEEYENSLTTLNTTNAEIKVLKARLEKHRIFAPFDGIIGLRSVSEGSYLNPGASIAEIYKIDPIKIEFSVPSKHLELVNVGDSIDFTVDAYDQVFHGEIYAMEPRIDPQTRSIKLRARAENKRKQLLPGQFARINLILEIVPNAFLIPTEAVIPELNGKKVLLYKQGKVHSQKIETGIRNEQLIQVVSGLNSGDTVLTTGILQVSQGSAVNINLK